MYITYESNPDGLVIGKLFFSPAMEIADIITHPCKDEWSAKIAIQEELNDIIEQYNNSLRSVS